MKSSPIIVLFSDPPPPMRRGPSSFLISLVVHGIAFALLLVGLNRPRKVDLRSDIERYAVRIMELHQPEPKKQQLAKNVNKAPGHQADAHPGESGGGPEAASAARIPLNFLSQKRALQTLIQPDVPRDLVLPQEAALPQVLQWSPPDPAITKIVPPPPQPVAEVKVQPTLDAPNQEVRVADVKISASTFDTKAPLTAPSKTSPVNVEGPQLAQRVPETASKDSGHATPGSVISLSDIKLQEGTAVLPMISEVATTPFAGSLSPGQPKASSQNGNGKTDSKTSGVSAGQTSGDQAGKTGNASDQVGKNGTSGGVAGQNGGSGPPGDQAGVNSGINLPNVVHIRLPRDGKFGVVVVGSSLADDYPETAELWRGRLAYTVYLHIGVTKNWILQYSLPRSQAAASAGSAGHLDAPWPYDITRPSIDADTNADAIMVHGFVNALGKFEQLSVIFPTELAETKFLLHVLQQWQFRPAMQTGQATPVEVLLIIPAATE